MRYDDGMEKLAIIGGGASGLAAAIAAADELRTGVTPDEGAATHDVEIVVYEADERVGRSILATGNGRCNFSNTQVNAGMYRNSDFVAASFAALQDASGAPLLDAASADCSCDNPVQAFFANLGLMWREEAQGRLYPLANKASSVLDVLRAAAHVRGVTEVCDLRAVRIDLPQQPGERMHVRFADGAVEHAQAVIVAIGGSGVHELLAGHVACTPAQPVLGPLRTKETLVKQLNNIRVKCEVSLFDASGEQKTSEQGEVLFRDYGVSGIAVFNLSRFAQPDDTLGIDFLPAYTETACEQLLQARVERLKALGCAPTGEDLLRGMVLPQVARVVLKAAGVDPEQRCAPQDLPVLAGVLKGLRLTVTGIGDARQCQVRRGGVDVASVDASTMELQQVKGLFAAGEALDVDAACGGFNLHWAWTSGLLAGRAAAQRLMEDTSHA